MRFAAILTEELASHAKRRKVQACVDAVPHAAAKAISKHRPQGWCPVRDDRHLTPGEAQGEANGGAVARGSA